MVDLDTSIGDTMNRLADAGAAAAHPLAPGIVRRQAERRRRRRLVGLSAGVTLVAAVVGVGVAAAWPGGSDKQSVRTVSPGPTNSAPVSTVPPPVPTSTTTGATTPATEGLAGGPTRSRSTTTTRVATLAPCRSSQLSAALTDTSGALGTIYSHLTFTNKSGQACTMSGYPGVSFVDGSGHQIGSPVPRSSNISAGTVTVASGGVAAASFAYHDAYVANGGQCPTGVPAAGLRVYPPGQTAAMFVPDPTLACPDPAATGEASISAVTTPGNIP